MNTNKKDVYEKFTYLFQDSIKIRMRSDVPFGAFLSGGLDSSCIVSQMSNFSNEPIETFTIGFKNKLFDESELAKLVSNKFKTSHHLGSVNPKNIDSAIFFVIITLMSHLVIVHQFQLTKFQNLQDQS